MNRLLPVLGVVALGAMTWFILSRPPAPSEQPKAAPATHPQTLATTAPLPELQLEPEAPPGPPTTFEDVQVQGVLGAEATWLAQLMGTRPEFKPVQGRPNAWQTDRMEVRWNLSEAGQVRSAEVLFRAEDALGGELTALSSFFVGNQDALPLTLETDDLEEAGRPVEGSFETRDALTYYYRATYRTGGQPPYGPERFEISRTPFR